MNVYCVRGTGPDGKYVAIKENKRRSRIFRGSCSDEEEGITWGECDKKFRRDDQKQ